MNEWLKYVPGFRSDTTWKKVIASIFYVILLICFIVDIESFLFLGGLGLLVFGVETLIKNLINKKPLKTGALLLVMSLIFFISVTNAIADSELASTKAEEASVALEENEKLQTENKNLISENESLVSENNNLTKEYEDLENQNSSLVQEKEDLQTHNEELNGEIENLQLENKDLKEENEKLIAQETKKEEAAEKQAQEEAKKQEQQKSASSSSSGSSDSSGSNGSSSASASQTNEQSQQVLITRTGSKYHRRACGNGNYFPATLSEAKSRGLTPCKKCY